MGTIQHHAIIAVSHHPEEIGKMHDWIYKHVDPNFQRLFSFTMLAANGGATITMSPDGSKEGWHVSAQGDAVRTEFIKKMEDSGRFIWVEVAFGELGYGIGRTNQDPEGVKDPCSQVRWACWPV